MKLKELLIEAETGKRPLEIKYPKIRHLADALGEEGGEELVKKAFSKAVEITTKMDGQQFAVYLDQEKKPTFYTKNMKLEPGEFELDTDKYKESRESGSDYADYGRAILHFQKLEKQGVLQKLPADTLISGEFFGSKKTNVIQYEREPKGNFVLFGARIGGEWASYPELVRIAKTLDVDVVPVLFYGPISDKKSFMKGLSATLKTNKEFMQQIKKFFEEKGNEKIESAEDLQAILGLFLNLKDPLLGAPHLEGIVMKQWDLRSPKGKELFYKLVRSEFAGERDANWSEVNKIGREMRNLSNQLRWRKISEKQYQQAIKKLDYYTYLMRATAFDALFGIENRVAKAIAGIKENNQEVNLNNVISWVKNDMKEENYPDKIANIYKKNEKSFDSLHQGKTPDDAYNEFFRTAMFLLKQNYNDVVNKVK